MKKVTLPSPIDAFVDAVNRHDTEAVLSFFADNGVVDDWGQRYVGKTAIRKWSDEQFVGAKGIITPTSVSHETNTVRLHAGWKSSFYTGDSVFVFVLAGPRIQEMRIPAH